MEGVPSLVESMWHAEDTPLFSLLEHLLFLSPSRNVTLPHQEVDFPSSPLESGQVCDLLVTSRTR